MNSKSSESNSSTSAPGPTAAQIGLFIIAGTSVLFAILHAVYPTKFDDKSAMFLGIAVAALVIDQITKFKGFGLEFEKEVKELSSAIHNLEKNVGPGSKSAVATPPAREINVQANKPQNAIPIDPNDPNKGQFGGSPEANGRKLTATLKPLSGERSSLCRVKFRVASTDPNRPLQEPVRIHLHPTFRRWSSYDLEVSRGIAEDEIDSYGAFTIGVEADGGTTRLELDLMDVSGGTRSFYEE